MRLAIGSLLLLLIIAGLGLAYVAGGEDDVEPAGAAEVPSLPEAVEAIKRHVPSLPNLTTQSEPAPPPRASGPSVEGRIEVSPDGGILITNIPDDPHAPRLERTPDGGVIITNQPSP